jgi:hypothetical protein
MSRVTPLGVSLALVVLAVVCSTALAAGSSYRNGAEIVSASLQRLEQGDDATSFATISKDGRYVAFQSRARNFFAEDDPDPPGHYRVGGIFRKDLVSGALELVADGDLKSSSLPDSSLAVVRGAQNPSISADGQYIAFETGQQLVPEDQNPNIDIYVRDMTVPIRTAGAYELVSARDGGTVGASYASTSRALGTDITRGRAISADGQKVVFKTTTASDLPAASGPTATPTQQVFVRDRAARSTTLVTLTNEPPTGQTELAPAGGADGGAVISADGTTVAWAGYNAFRDPATGEPGQTRFINGEYLGREAHYYFWRRIAEGAAATTRRITGAVDLDDPACPPDVTVIEDPTITGPCYGPLIFREDALFDFPAEPPVLSADGYKVSFLVARALRPSNQQGNAADLFFTDMSPGLSRKASTVELTRDIGSFDPVASGHLTSLSMTADGRYIAFTTVRTEFVLPSPHLVDAPAQTALESEIYVLNRERMEIERASRAWDGGEINEDTLDGLSISDDGARIAFVSQASNLFFGDGNGYSDAFVINRAQPGEQGGQAGVQDLPFDLPSQPANKRRTVPRIAVRVKSAKRGSVRLTVRVTDAGLVEARTLSRVRTSRTRPNRNAPLRTLARVRKRATRAGEVTLVLRTSSRYRPLLPKRGRLAARLLVSFTPADGGSKITARRSVALEAGSRRK